MGFFGQAVCCFLAALLHLLWRLLERIWPAEDVELAPEFPSTRLADSNPWAPSKVSYCKASLLEFQKTFPHSFHVVVAPLQF